MDYGSFAWGLIKQGRAVNYDVHTGEVRTFQVARASNAGLIAGLLGCAFGVLGIFTVGVIFVPLAALCGVVGLLRGLFGRSPSGIGTSVLAAVLVVLGFIASPSLWALLGLSVLVSQVASSPPPQRAQPITAPIIKVHSPSGMQKLSEVAWWSAHGGTQDDGSLTCGVVTVTPEGQDRKFVIEHVKGSDGFTLRLLKPTWAIPAGTKSQITVQFGYGRIWTFVAVGSATELRGRLPKSDVEAFMSGFQGAGSITIEFPRGNEQPWSLATGGYGFVEPDFIRCIKMFNPPKPVPPSQPFANPTERSGVTVAQQYEEKAGVNRVLKAELPAKSSVPLSPIYKLDQDRISVIELRNLYPDADCHPGGLYEGKIIRRISDEASRTISGVVIQSRNGDRNHINVAPDLQHADMVTAGWVSEGFRTLLKEGQVVSIAVKLCGAAGRVVMADGIAKQ